MVELVSSKDRVSTGVAGLDEVLGGGLLPGRAYLVRGGPGVGKTTLGLHLLTEGAANGESALLITLSEAETRIRHDAERLGLSLDGISVLDLSPSVEYFTEVESYDIFAPADVEREPLTKEIVDTVSRVVPGRVFIDSMTQLRYLSADTFTYRKQTLSFLRYLMEFGATIVFTSESSEEASDADLRFVADGIIEIASGREGRFVEVTKFRGSHVHGGRHSMKLGDTGMVVYPRLVPSSHGQKFRPEMIASGIPDLDTILHGGFRRGTVTVISGPSGSGKTTLALQIMKEAASRGDRSTVYAFEERPQIMIARCEMLNIPVSSMIERGTLSLVTVEPLQLAPDEFANLVRHDVEATGVRLVLVDSAMGYQLALPGEDPLVHLHALCQYLRNMGVTVFVIDEVDTIAGEFRATNAGISYLADNILILRYVEVREDGELRIRKGITVLKKRLSDFESTMSELRFTPYGLKVMPLPSPLQAIISAVPRAQGAGHSASG